MGFAPVLNVVITNHPDGTSLIAPFTNMEINTANMNKYSATQWFEGTSLLNANIVLGTNPNNYEIGVIGSWSSTAGNSVLLHLAEGDPSGINNDGVVFNFTNALVHTRRLVVTTQYGSGNPQFVLKFDDESGTTGKEYYRFTGLQTLTFVSGLFSTIDSHGNDAEGVSGTFVSGIHTLTILNGIVTGIT